MTILSCCSSREVSRFACAQAGCATCLETLLRENIGLVWMVLKRQATGEADYADLLQEGRIGLWRAILHYDPNRGYAFSSYASVVIRHQVWQAVEQSRKVAGWQTGSHAEDLLARVILAWQETQIRQALDEELELLPDSLRQIIRQRYGIGGTRPQNLAEIGRALGLSRQRIHQIHNEALTLLRLPALSIRLRSLCERQGREAYREALRQKRDWQRKYRGRK